MHRRNLVASTVLALTAGLTLGATALGTAEAAPRPTGHAGARTYTVSAAVNRTEPESGQKVKITGGVKPAAPHAQVTLQVKYAGQDRWKTIGHTRLSGASRYRFKDEVNSVRTRKYRVVKPAGNGRAAGQARTPEVVVYGWRPLTSLTPVGASGVYEAGNATINTVTYPDSLKSSGQVVGHVDYNLNRDCKSLDAVYGVDDGSPIGGTATLRVLADGAVAHTGSYGLTQAQRVVTGVTGVFRLTVEATPSGGAVAAVGAPKVLCSF